MSNPILYDYGEKHKRSRLRHEELTNEKNRVKSVVVLDKCPFCGSKAEMNVMIHTPKGFDYNPRCTNPSCCGRNSKKWQNLNYAVWAWNRRVE